MARSTAENQRAHMAARLVAYQARGAKGVAEAWWEEAKREAVRRANTGDEIALADLALTLQNWVARHRA